MTAVHVYDPGPDGFCYVCQEPTGYCKGVQPPQPPKRSEGEGLAAVLTVVPNGQRPAGRQV
jgi:hypothetical protein